jgi:hypothetical protein
MDTIIDRNTAFRQSRAYIRKRAWQVARATGIDFEELEAQANLIFCEACESYRPTKGTFATHLRHQLMRLYHFSQRHGRLITAPEDFDFDSIPAATKSERLQSLEHVAEISDLSADARKLLQLIIDNRNPKVRAVDSIHRAYGRRLGWAKSRTRQTMGEIEMWWRSNAA